ncbi:uncharacterized protein LOC120270697 [Dioscorea cayenensis subsp. rotundata]|uniref:Uncharacterized protein LOC120270697 n=1 Tax=Dioscorea cayennensis subsp. rotundata TaxID=55577 RepID=A0AB40C1S1_DIOCR|nr:uncharacterized protein LOC120270697 [Dioscorea cayenensis subsp. rotundata]
MSITRWRGSGEVSSPPLVDGIEDEPYLNKPIEDYDLIETICDNDQASGHYAIPSGSHIGTHMECNLEQEVFPPTQHFVDMSFGKTDAYGNTSPFAQPNTSEPVSATSPIQSKKQKGL